MHNYPLMSACCFFLVLQKREKAFSFAFALQRIFPPTHANHFTFCYVIITFYTLYIYGNRLLSPIIASSKYERALCNTCSLVYFERGIKWGYLSMLRRRYDGISPTVFVGISGVVVCFAHASPSLTRCKRKKIL